MNPLSRYELRPPATASEWATYHEVRRTVLFERRGLTGVYDDRHPDEHRPGNHPMLLFHDGDAVGVIRIDIDGSQAVFRRVAVREDVQRAGHGRVMIALAERFPRAAGCSMVRSYVDPGATGFYERCGYVAEGASVVGSGTAPMTKALGADSVIRD